LAEVAARLVLLAKELMVKELLALKRHSFDCHMLLKARARWQHTIVGIDNISLCLFSFVPAGKNAHGDLLTLDLWGKPLCSMK
jgi:hypothetical protein